MTSWFCASPATVSRPRTPLLRSYRWRRSSPHGSPRCARSWRRPAHDRQRARARELEQPRLRLRLHRRGDRWLVATVILEGASISIRRHGKLNAVRVRADQDLFTRGFRAACAAGGVPTAGAIIEADSNIPVGCGLGSSAAAIVAGALLADAALELGLSRAEVLQIGTTIEGHPDNVGPAIHGGA